MANMTSGSNESQEQRSSPAQGSTDLGNKLSQGANEVTEQALARVQRTRDRLEDELAQRRFRLSERMRELSDVLEGAGRKLGDDDVVADGLQYVSGKIERVASYIESADPNQVARDLRDAVRGRPAWFFGGAFVAGLALARFAKSSADAVAEVAGEDEAPRARATGSMQSARPPETGVRPTPASTQQSGQPGAAGTREATPGGSRPPAVPTSQGVRQP